MNNEEDKWIEEVFESMRGSQRAKPNPNLFLAIKEEIASSSYQVIPIYQLRGYAAAGVLALLINVSFLTTYNQYEELPDFEVAEADMYNKPLITSFQIYE